MIFKIKDKREALRISQTELGRRLNVTPQVVHHWEAGTAEPRARDLPAIAKALECEHIDDLYPEELRP